MIIIAVALSVSVLTVSLFLLKSNGILKDVLPDFASPKLADSNAILVSNSVDNEREHTHLLRADFHAESNVTDLREVRAQRLYKQ